MYLYAHVQREGEAASEQGREAGRDGERREGEGGMERVRRKEEGDAHRDIHCTLKARVLTKHQIKCAQNLQTVATGCQTCGNFV